MFKILPRSVRLDYGNVQTTIKLYLKKCKITYTLKDLEKMEELIIRRLRKLGFTASDKILNLTILELLNLPW